MAKVYSGFYPEKTCKSVRRLLKPITTLVSALYLSVRLGKERVRDARKEKAVLLTSISKLGTELRLAPGAAGPSWGII